MANLRRTKTLRQKAPLKRTGSLPAKRSRPPRVSPDRKLLHGEAYKAAVNAMWERQNGLCAICGKWMTPEAAQFDHERSRGMGGAFRDDAILHPDGRWKSAAVHGVCNSLKGSRTYEWNGSNTEYKEKARA